MKAVELEHVQVTQEQQAIVGSLRSGRTFCRVGNEKDFRGWYDVLAEAFGPMMQPGEVGLYLDVSRTTVSKRVESGRLTAFVFQVSGEEERTRTLRQRDVTLIPWTECRGWDAERKKRMEDALREEVREGEDEVERLQREVQAKDQQAEEYRKQTDRVMEILANRRFLGKIADAWAIVKGTLTKRQEAKLWRALSDEEEEEEREAQEREDQERMEAEEESREQMEG